MKSGLIKATRCGPTPRREGAGRHRGKGRAFEWLCKHVSYVEKKCLFWPFSKSSGHPGPVAYCGKIYKAARLMCLLAHGAPPSNLYQACHTCGRGNKGCINPHHLGWKTSSEARRDEVRNGQRKSYGKGGKIHPLKPLISERWATLSWHPKSPKCTAFPPIASVRYCVGMRTSHRDRSARGVEDFIRG
jgi:hypothetical protein